MATNDESQEREKIYQFDESIFKPREMERVQLPGDEGLVYEESQPFSQLWVWILMALELVIGVIALFQSGQALWTIGMGLGAMTITMAVLGALNLYTRIDAEGVHFRMKPFHLREQTIAWEEIDQIHVRRYQPIMEYGGWGIRYGRNGKAFNVRGDYGIQIVKKNGKRVLIGTQRPDEVARHLSTHPLLV
jgi:hypothetical protein